MCKVIVKEPEKHIGFILTNHLYSRKPRIFTLKEIIEEMKQYNIVNRDNEIIAEINDLLAHHLAIPTIIRPNNTIGYRYIA
ncbi:MAG: hypothetical protein J6S67_12720 [Methanobrevibacter sp.]|nr:hypothetical protein [Methanobrevibacter sp.]